MKDLTIQQTYNYDAFKTHVDNRAINDSHVARLITLNKDENFMHLFPIICTQDFRIIDGQHRWMACKHLECPIYYLTVADEDFNPTMLININTSQKTWSMEDYLQFWEEHGNPGYLKVRQWYKDKDLSLDVFFLVTPGQNPRKDFRHGNLPEESIDTGLYYLDKIYYAFQVLEEKGMPKAFYRHRPFQEAIFAFIRNDNVDFEEFLRKIGIMIHKLQKQVTGSDMIRHLIDLYNNRRQKDLLAAVEHKHRVQIIAMR